ncbi:MAG: hypothetical protein IPL43_00210 [Micropruina sp.]|nr:hypothetical protein [Micropruina sp.]
MLQRCGGSGLSRLGVLIKHALTGSHTLTDTQAATAVHRYQHLLRAVGDGIKLTAAGYLPPRTVHTLYTDLDLHEDWIGSGNREDLTLPVLDLRHTATTLGLLRKHNGHLTLTRAGRQHVDNPRQLLAHIGSRLPTGRPEERDAGLLALLHDAADQPQDPEQAPANILQRLGWRVAGTTLDSANDHWARLTNTVLDHLTEHYLNRSIRATIARTLLRRT